MNELILRINTDEAASEWLFEVYKSLDIAIDRLEEKGALTEHEREELGRKQAQREKALNALLTLQDHKL